MATLYSTSLHSILHRFVLRRPNFRFASSITQPQQLLPIRIRTTPSFHLKPFSTRSLVTDDVALVENEQSEPELESFSISTAADNLQNLRLRVTETTLPVLTVKEKKDLASYAHSLGKKLKSQQVGKSGVTDLVITALIETLEANELLKIKIHSNCPAEMEDAVKRLEEGTGSVVVGRIGRTVILYRPSMTKMKAEEKKKQNKIIYLKKQAAFRQFTQNKRPVSGEESRFSRGRRGSSRY